MSTALTRLDSRQPKGFTIRVRRTRAERIEVAEKICAMYSHGRYSIANLCKHYLVKLEEFMAWACITSDITAMVIQGRELPKKCLPEVHTMYKEAIKRAQAMKQHTLKEKAMDSLLRKVEGVEYEEVVEEEELDTETHLPDGEENPNYGQMKVVKRKTKRGRHAPDTTAIVFALTNLESDTWKNRNQQTVDGTVKHEHEALKSYTDEEITQKRKEIAMQLQKAQNRQTENE